MGFLELPIIVSSTDSGDSDASTDSGKKSLALFVLHALMNTKDTRIEKKMYLVFITFNFNG